MSEGVRTKVPLSSYTTLHIGGVADYLWEVTTVEELKAAAFAAKEQAQPLLVLGGGSNVLVSDEGFRGLVVVNKIKQRSYTVDGEIVTLTLGAGEVLDEVVAWTADKGWWGLENLSAIPGTVGATPVQNVGAYGVEVSSLIVSVKAYHCETAEEKIFSHSECQFAYRDSFFKTTEGKKWIIVEVTYQLSLTPTPLLAYADLAALSEHTESLSALTVRNEIIRVRSKKFPDWSVVGTAGSFFKNPIILRAHYESLLLTHPGIPGYSHGDQNVKVSLGYVLDKVCGLRGYCEGEVCLFQNQALVLVAHEGATAIAVKEFVNTISKKVFTETNITIECEVQFV